MTQHYELTRYTECKKISHWLAERGKLVNSLERLRRTSETMAVKAQELKELLEEVHFNLADSRSLRIKLNDTAIRFDVALIARRRVEP